ncbi:hypothetical protein HanXRQr2_Chr06g0256581 [Helianthus annuus]|uniref:Uncharacterized protein n=1 Tax=Helianthus annuus TaxID=4232 RepID=A0A9K3IUA4_HELAN|nr:hypothetical protein HanXRQr2_Chr06g0256581 [Helianthus annuus]
MDKEVWKISYLTNSSSFIFILTHQQFTKLSPSLLCSAANHHHHTTTFNSFFIHYTSNQRC